MLFFPDLFGAWRGMCLTYMGELSVFENFFFLRWAPFTRGNFVGKVVISPVSKVKTKELRSQNEEDFNAPHSLLWIL